MATVAPGYLEVVPHDGSCTFCGARYFVVQLRCHQALGRRSRAITTICRNCVYEADQYIERAYHEARTSQEN